MQLNNGNFPTNGFANELLDLIIGMCIKTLFDLMQSTAQVVKDVCRQYDLSVNLNKTSNVLFTEK